LARRDFIAGACRETPALEKVVLFLASSVDKAEYAIVFLGTP